MIFYHLPLGVYSVTGVMTQPVERPTGRSTPLSNFHPRVPNDDPGFAARVARLLRRDLR